MTAADDRPQTRLARLTRWVPTPRRAWRAARRRPLVAGLLTAAGLGLYLLIYPHARAAAVGHRLRYDGHGVTFGHYLDEDLRAWAPLPADSFLWTTPVGVAYRGGEWSRGSVSGWLDRVETLPHVTCVEFDGAELSAEQARRAAAMHEDPVVDLSRLWLEPGALRAFARLPNVGTFFLDDANVPPGELAPLAGAARLTGVAVPNCYGVRGELVPLAGHATLEWVLAEGSDFGDADFIAVGECPSLDRLYLDRTDVGDAGLAAFGPHPGLRWLHLGSARVTDAGLLRLAERCPNLEALTLSGTAVTDAGLPALARLPKLTSLALSDTAVTAAAVEALIRPAAADGRELFVTR